MQFLGRKVPHAYKGPNYEHLSTYHQRFATQKAEKQHTNCGCDEIGCVDDSRALIRGNTTIVGEDVGRVEDNCVDACELLESGEADAHPGSSPNVFVKECLF